MSSGTLKYSIVPITEKDTERVIDFLYRFFFRDEPMVECLGILRSPEDRCKALEDFSAATIPGGLSLMAVDDQGKILGVRLSELLTRDEHSKKTPEGDEKMEQYNDPRMKLIWELLEKVYWETNPFERFPEVDKVMGFKLLSVDSAYRGLGLSKALVEKAVALAKQHGIPLVRVDCSSAYSAKAMVSQGFELIYSLPFSEYLDSEGRPVLNPKPPHTVFTSFIKRVDSF